jgi:SAM-dependent methyltransferase
MESKKCKICNQPTIIWGCVDFNKSCIEEYGKYLEYSGRAIYYSKCPSCNHIFTTDFDQWTKDDYLKNIYNDEYLIVDPDYGGVRSSRDVIWFTKFLNGIKDLDILDYGAGTGEFGRQMNALGYRVESWDPMWNKPISWDKNKKFDLITAFEVIEHSPTPKETLDDMHQWLKPGGKILITSLANDVMQGKREATHWYLSPRNGHVCMFSIKSMETLFATKGMKMEHDGPNVHLAYYP